MEAAVTGTIEAVSSSVQHAINPEDRALLQKCFGSWKFETAFGTKFPREGDTEISIGVRQQNFAVRMERKYK